MSSSSPPFSPVGSFLPREEFAPMEASQSAVASLTLSGAGGIRVTGVQQELIYYLNSLFARPTNFISTSPPPSSSDTNVIADSPVQAYPTDVLPSPSPSSIPPSRHQASTSTTGSSTGVGAAPPGPPIWTGGLLHSSMISGQAGAWQYELARSPWRCSPKEELASVRLSIALVQTLNRFGWALGTGVNAGRRRDDHHTFLLTSPPTGPPASPSVTTQAFAISFPQPNIISVIDPPQNLTPTILQAIRAAALEAEGIAEEGWVKGTQRNPGGGSGGGGAYKFQLRGYKSWYRPGFPRAKYEANAPPLLARLISVLDSHGMKVAVSIQIRPTSHFRDLWIVTSTTPVPPPSTFSPSSANNLGLGGLSRTGTANTSSSRAPNTPTLGINAQLPSSRPPGPHSRQSSISATKPGIPAILLKKQLSNASVNNKRGSVLSKKNQPNPPPLVTSHAPPPSAYVPPSASPRKQDFAVLSAHPRELSIADSGVAGVGAGERATPMIAGVGAAFEGKAHQPVATLPMKTEGGGTRFAEGRDSTVSMGETDGGEGAASYETVYLPIEWDGPQDPNRISEVTEPLSSARQTYATQKSWESVVEPGRGGPRPETQFFTPGNNLDDVKPQYRGIEQVNAVPADRRRQGESLLKGED